MPTPHPVSCLLLALSLVLGGPAVAQQVPDTTAPLEASQAEVSPLPQDSVLVAPPTVAPEPEPAAADAAAPDVVPLVPVAPPQATPGTPPVQDAPSPTPPQVTLDSSPDDPGDGPADGPADGAVLTDSLAAELAELRGAVLGLAAQNDSLRRALARQITRVDTVVVRDTTARRVAQETVERAGDEVQKVLQNFVPKLIISLLLLVLALYVVRGLEWLLEALAGRSAERRLFYKKLIPIVRLLVWAFTIYLVVAAVFNIPANSLLAAAAAIGVAVGFAAQEVLKNIFGGIVIIFDQPFQVGDKIAVGGTYGEVISIGLRSTRIVTPDDNLVSVPNSQVVADQVSNANAGELNLQVVTDLYLPGWIDVALAKRIAYAAAANSRYVYLDKPIVVIAKDEFKETFLVHLKVKAYVLDTRYEFLLMSDVTEAAKSEFIRHGLLTPMPIGVDVDVDVDFDVDDDADAATSDGSAGAAAPPLVTPSRGTPPDDA